MLDREQDSQNHSVELICGKIKEALCAVLYYHLHKLEATFPKFRLRYVIIFNHVEGRLNQVYDYMEQIVSQIGPKFLYHCCKQHQNFWISSIRIVGSKILDELL